MITISRDEFAREELVRENYYQYDALTNKHQCDWCGYQSEVNKHGQRKLFKYAIIQDDEQHVNYIKGKFCSIGCMKSYHE